MSRQVIPTSLSVGLATGLYGLSFGAIGSAAGLGVPAVMLLSLLMFSARVNLHLLESSLPGEHQSPQFRRLG